MDNISKYLARVSRGLIQLTSSSGVKIVEGFRESRLVPLQSSYSGFGKLPAPVVPPRVTEHFQTFGLKLEGQADIGLRPIL